ncbi:uncharacterized protein JCM15063_003382 [Sporobolomyces koalae]|uniref:uncharacterized protein n=1 Tax=Sporobolomyces koalae TaxID=500713 RepID=UPI00316CC79C
MTAASTTPSVLRRSSHRWRRPNYWLGKVIPSLLVVFGYYGYRLVLLEVYPLLKRRNRTLAYLYIAWVNLFLALVVFCYALVYFHPRPQTRVIPEAVHQRKVVFVCDERGDPLVCDQDACNGSYQSIRTRHCRDCRVCQPGFDHHCAFMDACVATESTFKPFVNFILFAVLLLCVALVPLAPLQYRAFKEVVETTWATHEMKSRWWDRWYSWAGGPVWRWAGAIILGYVKYPAISQDRPFLVSGHRTRTLVRDGITYAYDESLYPKLAIPTLSTLAIVAFATLIVGIGFAMLVVITLNARKGVSTVQVERSKRFRAQHRASSNSAAKYDPRIRLWVPLLEGDESPGAIVLVEPDTPLYDFGPMQNWRNLMGSRWWQWFDPTRIPVFDDTVINPSILAHLQERARKQL